MAKKKTPKTAEQQAWDERTQRIDTRLGTRSKGDEPKLAGLLRGTFEERTRKIEAHLAKLEERAATA